MAVHSTCQPGRPGPDGEGHEGSPGRSARQSNQSSGWRFPGSAGITTPLGEELQHLLLGEAGDGPELGSRRHREVHVAVDLIGGTPIGQAFDQIRDLVDDLGHADVLAWRKDAERRHVRAEELDLVRGQLSPVDAVTVGTFQQWIVHVRGVLRVVHVVARITPHPVDKIEGEVRVGMPEMGGVVGGDTTDVHPGLAARPRRAGLPRGRVVQTQGEAGTGQRGNVR
jgi:hypothetical protein